ncbi:glycosyl hydrolase [Thermothelomyces heterothallicus CBS 202.75]|uniref:glycosyl hydrolase n=1 Tax=Thermothelomyces heterothallicus CBS 202.75 TaxID=1149848 RepID=UPI0037421F48
MACPPTVIRQAEIDLTTGKLVTEARDVWAGTGGNCPEGPHLYKKNGWYYLMIAEGGTHRRHKVAMARSKAATGPFEGHEKNPLITGAPGSPITCLGERGASYPLGRETYMVPVEWPEGEFPIFEPVQLRHYLPASRRSIVGAKQRIPGFESPAAAIKLRLTDTELGATAGSPTFVGQRQTALESTAKAEIDLASAAKTGHAGLAVYKDPFRYASVDVDLAAGRVSVNLGHAAQELTTSNSKPLAGAAAIKLTIETSVETYSFPGAPKRHPVVEQGIRNL